jgi:hypothetical protein
MSEDVKTPIWANATQKSYNALTLKVKELEGQLKAFVKTNGALRILCNERYNGIKTLTKERDEWRDKYIKDHNDRELYWANIMIDKDAEIKENERLLQEAKMMLADGIGQFKIRDEKIAELTKERDGWKRESEKFLPVVEALRKKRDEQDAEIKRLTEISKGWYDTLGEAQLARQKAEKEIKSLREENEKLTADLKVARSACPICGHICGNKGMLAMHMKSPGREYRRIHRLNDPNVMREMFDNLTASYDSTKTALFNTRKELAKCEVRSDKLWKICQRCIPYQRALAALRENRKDELSSISLLRKQVEKMHGDWNQFRDDYMDIIYKKDVLKAIDDIAGGEAPYDKRLADDKSVMSEGTPNPAKKDMEGVKR